jgi:2'-5' RNA ligase
LEKTKGRFFIALVPPQAIQNQAREIQHYFAQTYSSRKALNSPPHITLQPPFEWELDEMPVLEETLKAFAETRLPVPVSLKGFGAFTPRVIFINVLKSPELLTLQKDLMAHMEASLEIVDARSRSRPFAPHLTLAFRDLTRQNFRKSWPEFEHREFDIEFTASKITLLAHDGRRWNIRQSFSLAAGKGG